MSPFLLGVVALVLVLLTSKYLSNANPRALVPVVKAAINGRGSRRRGQAVVAAAAAAESSPPGDRLPGRRYGPPSARIPWPGAPPVT